MKTHRAQRRIMVSISYLLQIPNAVDEAGYSTSKMYYSRKYWNYILPFANPTGFLHLRYVIYNIEYRYGILGSDAVIL